MRRPTFLALVLACASGCAGAATTSDLDDAGARDDVATGRSDAETSDAARDDATAMGDAGSIDGASAVDAEPATDSGPASCDHLTVMPEADATAALQSALDEASTSRVGAAVGVDPAGTPQGRVRLPPGTYGLGTIDVPSNVRLEIDPGATLRPLAGTLVVFQLGDGDRRGGGTHVSNVTITAGDGCGGAGTAPSRAGSEITSTDFRHNDPVTAYSWPDTRPTRGMANAAIPWSGDWPVETMWVFDLDPRATGADEGVRGFDIVWADDVLIERVFSIQNAERFASDDPSTLSVVETDMLVPGVASRSTVMMFSPLPFGVETDRATARVPRRIHVAWHYNVLSPPGQGPNQIRTCIDCTFEHVFSHGGVAVRPETDGVLTSCPANDCSCDGGATTGPVAADGSLVGFREFALVDGLSVSYVEGVHGNAAVLFNPHCLSNGTAVIEQVRGTDLAYGIVAAGPRNGAPGEALDGGAGSFARVTFRDLTFFGGPAAQDRTTMGAGGVPGGWRGYELGPSSAAVARGGGSYPLVLGGDLCWPSSGAERLADGELSSATGTYALMRSGCASSF